MKSYEILFTYCKDGKEVEDVDLVYSVDPQTAEKEFLLRNNHKYKNLFIEEINEHWNF